MSTTTILSSITRSGSYPISTSIQAENLCGTISISLGGTWTQQMIAELPTLNFGVFMSDGTKLISVDFDLTTYMTDKGKVDPTEPYTMALYGLPESFTLKTTPLFDDSALSSHNSLIESGMLDNFSTAQNGIVDTNTENYTSELWTTPTSTFTLDISFDDANIVPGGGGGGTPYVLPIADTTTLGGVMASDSINVDSDGVMDLGQSVGGDGLEVVSGSVLPAEYTPVEYLYGTGQCIQNLYAMTANGIRIETEFACDVPSSGEIDIIGGGGDPNWANVPILILQTSATINGASGHNTDVTLTDYQIATWLYNTYAISGVTPSINTFHTVVADWYIVNGQMSITVDGDTHSYNCDYTRATNLCLFGNGQGGNNPANIKMKYLKIYQGSMDYPAMNLIPVKNSSNVYGMYDTVSGTFFTKTGGTGDFSGGSEITLPTSSVINVIPATTNDIGGVIVGDSLAVDNTGVLSFDPPIMTLQEYNDLQTKDSPIYFIYEQ